LQHLLNKVKNKFLLEQNNLNQGLQTNKPWKKDNLLDGITKNT